jgi:hypothetical protein
MILEIKGLSNSRRKYPDLGVYSKQTVDLAQVIIHFFLTSYPNFFFFCFTEAWTQGLHLEPHHQPFFVKGFFKMSSHGTICPGWLWTMIFLISASWVARITGVSYSAQHTPIFNILIIMFRELTMNVYSLVTLTFSDKLLWKN